MHQLPEKFIQHIRTQLNIESELFMDALKKQPPTSIRVNTSKNVSSAFLNNKNVPWCNQGFYLNQRPSFISNPLIHAGAFYVQEASSMFLGKVVETIKPHLLPHAVYLDLCAAPGGKSTQLLNIINQNDLLVANEVIQNRAETLVENLTKWGADNVVITNNDARDFVKLPQFFDVVLVDAPCSGEGMFRKDPSSITEWSEENVNHCALRQKRILTDVVKSIKPGGFLIYSTCTFNIHENEEQLDWLNKNYGFQAVRVPLNNNWQIVESNYNQQFGYRFYPNKLDGEGFFIAVLKKAGQLTTNQQTKIVSTDKNTPTQLLNKFLTKEINWHFLFSNQSYYAVKPQFLSIVNSCLKELKVKTFGIKLGKVMHQQLIPDHALALNICASPDIPAVDLDLTQALLFLKKETFDIPLNNPGWCIAKYNGFALGWIKVLSNRINNYYPASYRILKDLNELLQLNQDFSYHHENS